MEGGGGSVSVRNVLSGSGAGGVILWGRDLGFVGGDVQEDGGGARGVPHTGSGKDGQAVEGRDLEKHGSSECTQRSRNADTGDVH